MKEDLKAMLPIIQGYADGKTVECRRKDMGFAPWDKVDIVFDWQFDLQHYEYRIKPEESAIQKYNQRAIVKPKTIMRTIKFKAKRIDNGEWLEGYYRGSNFEGKAFINRIKRPPLAFEVVPDTVCQFTGLFDKNGKEIYEGDILSIQGAHFFPCRIPLDLIWRVVFDQGAFCAYDERKKYVRGPLGNYDENITSKWEVKGNIHDPSCREILQKS